MSNSHYRSYESQSSTSSESSQASRTPRNVVQYGPIQVRVCRKVAPTLATGRRSKNMTLHGEEAARREKRREKNRLAAKKLKEKRQMIEDELMKELEVLQNEHTDLQSYLAELQYQKQCLEAQIQRLFPDAPDPTLLNDEEAMAQFFEQYLGDFDLDDDSIESIFDLQLTGDQSD